MKVQVIGVAGETDGPVEVTFRTSSGVAAACWRSKTHKPQVGMEYDAELDISETADRNSNTQKSEYASPALAFHGRTVVLRGTIESIDEDGLAYLRLAPDSLVMIDTTGGVSPGDLIQLSVPIAAVSLTPTGI